MTTDEPWPGESDLDELVRRELRLLDPAVRADRAAVDALLEPSFVEHGASGRVWDRESTLSSLEHEPPGELGEPEVLGPATTALGPHAVLLRYRLRSRHGESLRCSVWSRSPDGQWRLAFHQGTPVPAQLRREPDASAAREA